MTQIRVLLISAPWCKRCHTLKPDITALCAMTGATLEHANYDDWDEEEQQVIKSLPTIRLSVDAGATWTDYTAATFDVWKAAMLANVQTCTTDEDF